jgi:hypothetical protein
MVTWFWSRIITVSSYAYMITSGYIHEPILCWPELHNTKKLLDWIVCCFEFGTPKSCPSTKISNQLSYSTSCSLIMDAKQESSISNGEEGDSKGNAAPPSIRCPTSRLHEAFTSDIMVINECLNVCKHKCFLAKMFYQNIGPSSVHVFHMYWVYFSSKKPDIF